MRLDPATCYAAMETRDRRFDGRFFVGVRTTGIYCRPVCPARTPRRDHVDFYASPAAAEEAGFRPCRRCRPETAPASPAWQGTSATVTRALRLLASETGRAEDAGEGAVAHVARLAERLGLGERHLRRLFAEHVGASPRAVLMTQRVHFARRLLDETTLPIEAIAHASGFGSGRRLRAAVTQTFGRGPAALRKTVGATRAKAKGGGGAPIELRLPFVPPYDFETLLAYRKERAIPGVETVEGAAYRRTIAGPGGPGVLEVERAPGKDSPRALTLRLWLSDPRDLFTVVERARRMLDLDADSAAIATHLARDPALKRLIAQRPGLRVPGAWDPFELAVRAVLGQQVSVRAATTLSGRLVERLGTLSAPGEALGVPRTFPTPEAIAHAGVPGLSGMGLTGARVASLVALAQALESGTLALAPAADLDEAIARLTAVPGIGPWTAHYVALRGLAEPDAFPSGDLGLRKALARAGSPPLSAAALLARAERWRPFRGYAAFHLWMSLA